MSKDNGRVEQDVGERVMLNVDELMVDMRYQRILSEPRVNEYAASWDWKLADEIKVSRRKNGTLVVVDGQHRVQAALRADIKQLPARIYTGLTLEQEADIFIKGTRQRKSMTALEVWKSALTASAEEYPMEHEIDEIVRRAGTYVNEVPNAEKGINAPVALVDLYKMGSGVLVEDTLEVLILAFSEPKRDMGGTMFNAGLIKGLGMFIGMFTDPNAEGDLIRLFDRERLVDRLADDGVRKIMQQANAYRTLRGPLGHTTVSAVYYAIIDCYNDRLRDTQRLPDRRPDRRAIAQKFIGTPWPSPHRGQGTTSAVGGHTLDAHGRQQKARGYTNL